MGVEIPGFEAGFEVVADDAFGEQILRGVAGLRGSELSEALFKKLAAPIAPGFRPIGPAVIELVAADPRGILRVVAQHLLEGFFEKIGGRLTIGERSESDDTECGDVTHGTRVAGFPALAWDLLQVKLGMTLKSAAFLAVVGMAMLTVLISVNLLTDVSGVARGLVPYMAMLKSLVEWLASLSLLIFFAVFYRKQ
jgi:hypothetical protein